MATRAAEAIAKLHKLLDKHANAITRTVRKYAASIGDDDTARNLTTAGMENEEAIEIGICTIEYLSRWETA